MKMVSARIISMAFGLVFDPVPGATPKKPASGINRPKPAVRTDAQPGDIIADRVDLPSLHTRGGTSMARLVLPQALGKAPQT